MPERNDYTVSQRRVSGALCGNRYKFCFTDIRQSCYRYNTVRINFEVFGIAGCIGYPAVDPFVFTIIAVKRLECCLNLCGCPFIVQMRYFQHFDLQNIRFKFGYDIHMC